MHRTLLLAAAFTLALALAACGGAAPVVLPTEAPLTDADLAMAWNKSSNRSSSSFSETVVVRGEFSDGGNLYVRMVVSNVAGADGRAELLARVNLPDGRMVQSKLRRARGDWSSGAERFELTLQGNKLAAGVGGATFQLRTPELEADLLLTNPHGPLRPPGGTADLGQGKYYSTTILVPRGQLRGEIRVPASDEGGEATRLAVAGPAYMEHRAGNLAPYSLAVGFYNLLHIGADHNVLFTAFERTPRLGGRTQGFLYYATDQELVTLVPEVEVVPTKVYNDTETGYEVPVVVALKGKGGFTGVVRALQEIKRINDLGSLSKMERFVVERLMKPWTFRYDADYLLQLDRRGKQKLKGHARYQYQRINE